MANKPTQQVVIERRYKATLERVWELWTTKSGIESWWGPDGFTVTIDALQLHAGGELRHTMTATGSEQIQFMNQMGMPLATELLIVFVDVEPMHRIEYTALADFIPGTEPYDVTTTVQFDVVEDEVRIVLSFDVMHDDVWTERARLGHEGELAKLDRILR